MHWLPYIMQPLLCAAADPIHCSEPHTSRAKTVTDRTLPKFGLLSVSECVANFRCLLERNIERTYMSTCSWSAHRNAPCHHQTAARIARLFTILRKARSGARMRSSKAIVLLRR
jgi:hypothetical protein